MRGTIAFTGTNTVGGAIVSTGDVVRVNGVLATPGHVDQGLATSGGDNTLTVLGYGNGNVARLVVSNAVIEKSVYLNYSGDTGIYSEPGSTNVFKGHITWPIPWLGFAAGKNSEMVFEGGFTTGWSMRSFGSDSNSIIRIRKTPVTAVQSVGWNVQSGTVSFEVASNKVTNLSTGYYSDNGSRNISFGVSYALSEEYDACLLNGFYWKDGTGGGLLHAWLGTATIDLNDTTQRVATLVGSSIGKFTGRAPATIEILKQKTSSNLASSNLWVASSIEGHVSLAMYGTENPLILTNRAFASYGDIVVANGVMEFATNASWLNGTNVTVCGDGVLKIGGRDTFGKDHAVIRFADNGKIDVPAGVIQTFAEGWVGENKLAGGRNYTASTLPDHISGGGTIRIAGSGFSVLLR